MVKLLYDTNSSQLLDMIVALGWGTAHKLDDNQLYELEMAAVKRHTAHAFETPPRPFAHVM